MDTSSITVATSLRFWREISSNPGTRFPVLTCSLSHFLPSGPTDESHCSALARRDSVPEKFLDDLLESVFTDVDDADFPFGIFRRIAGVGGVDHDGLAELAADRAGRRFGGIGRPKHVADFADGFD